MRFDWTGNLNKDHSLKLVLLGRYFRRGNRKRSSGYLWSAISLAVGPFPLDPFLQLFLLILNLIMNDFLLLFAAVLTVLDNFFHCSMGM